MEEEVQQDQHEDRHAEQPAEEILAHVTAPDARWDRAL
jgi:hypothetical protein